MGCVQKMFEEISLKKNQSLWMSDDDSLLEERIRLLLSFPQTSFAAAFACKSRCIFKKNEKLSSTFREKGNLANAQGNIELSLSLYNRSLMYSPRKETTALILGDRASVLIEKGELDLGIQDLKTAIESLTPKSVEYKLYERLGEALEEKGDFTGAREAYENSLSASEEALKIGSGKLNSFQHRINNKIKNIGIHTKTSRNGFSSFKVNSFFNIPKKYQSPGFPSLVDGIKVAFDQQKGRHIIADRDISPGEMIAADEPYTWMLDRDETRFFCWHCFSKVIAPLPCPDCVITLYCSDDCMTAAKTEYHRYECDVIDLLYSGQIGSWALAFKAIIRKPLEYYESKASEFNSHDIKRGYESTCSYDTRDIFSFHNLVTHDNEGHKRAPELMMQALTALFIFRLLEESNYVPKDAPEKKSIFIIKLVHHFMRVVYYNTHEITAIESDTGGREYKVKRIGRATNPTLALFNHSCDPNYRRISVGNRTYGFACKPIEKGAEIFDTYTPSYAAVNKENRTEFLKKYNFVCGCTPCVKDLPTLEFLPKDVAKGPCKKTANKFHASLSRFYSSDESCLGRNLNILLKTYEDMHKLLKGTPHQFLLRAEADVYNALLTSVYKIGAERTLNAIKDVRNASD